MRAHLNLMREDGSGFWLFAMPSKLFRLDIDSAAFIVLLQRRLRMQIFSDEFFCPLCDEVMDKYADHALICACGGDRAKRHNLCRNDSAHRCAAAGLAPEVEKEGLLEARLDNDRLGSWQSGYPRFCDHQWDADGLLGRFGPQGQRSRH